MHSTEEEELRCDAWWRCGASLSGANATSSSAGSLERRLNLKNRKRSRTRNINFFDATVPGQRNREAGMLKSAGLARAVASAARRGAPAAARGMAVKVNGDKAQVQPDACMMRRAAPAGVPGSLVNLRSGRWRPLTDRVGVDMCRLRSLL